MHEGRSTPCDCFNFVSLSIWSLNSLYPLFLIWLPSWLWPLFFNQKYPLVLEFWKLLNYVFYQHTLQHFLCILSLGDSRYKHSSLINGLEIIHHIRPSKRSNLDTHHWLNTFFKDFLFVTLRHACTENIAKLLERLAEDPSGDLLSKLDMRTQTERKLK